MRPREKDTILMDILTETLVKDIKFQIFERQGRKGASMEPDDKNDKHKSFLRHYVLYSNFRIEPFSRLFLY